MCLPVVPALSGQSVIYLQKRPGLRSNINVCVNLQYLRYACSVYRYSPSVHAAAVTALRGQPVIYLQTEARFPVRCHFVFQCTFSMCDCSVLLVKTQVCLHAAAVTAFSGQPVIYLQTEARFPVRCHFVFQDTFSMCEALSL